VNLRAVRYFAAAMAAVTAAIYFVIGLGVVNVLDDSSGNAQAVFGGIAGLGFLVGVVLLLVSERRLVWLLGAVLQVSVIAMYFNVAPERTPNYEFWGLVLRVPQVLILAALGYLLVKTWGKARGPKKVAHRGA
jgi:flagellar biosynthesis protein FliR